MIIKIKLLPKEKEYQDFEVKDGAIGQDLFEKLKLHPDAYIIAREGSPIPIDEKLKEGEKISLIQVVSGGLIF